MRPSIYFLVATLSIISPLVADPPPLHVVQTAKGTHFGVYGEKPAKPAATIFILASGITSMRDDPKRYYSATGDELEKSGWLAVVLDPPCHGYDQLPDEPSGLGGWAHRVKQGQDLMSPFAAKCSDVLDHLIAEGYTDVNRVAASGTSRGGFCALHFAAGDPRVKIVSTVSPVTNPLALSEFAGVTAEQARSINIDSYVEKLAGRTIWLTIGNDDPRVSTDDCVSLARKLVAVNRRLNPDQQRVPVELIVGPSIGHRAIDDVYAKEAEFLQMQFPAGK